MAELEQYIKRYERDTQLKEGADSQSPTGWGQGNSRPAFRGAAPGRR